MIDIEKGKMIKVHVTLDAEKAGVAGESLWAEYLGDGLARLQNTPFFTDKFSWGDIVRIKEEEHYFEVVELVSKAAKTVIIEFELTGEPKPMECAVCGENKEHQHHPEDLKKWKQIVDYLKSIREKYSLGWESARLGHFSIHVPVNMNDEKIEEICKNCPVELIIHKF